jgi:hypothetical protein
MSNLSTDKGIPVKFCSHPTHLERSSEKEFFLSTDQNDKNSLWVGLNIRKTEWHVKQKRPPDGGGFLKPSGGEPHKKLSQWAKDNQRPGFRANKIHGPLSSHRNSLGNQGQRRKNQRRKSENLSHPIESSQGPLHIPESKMVVANFIKI